MFPWRRKFPEGKLLKENWKTIRAELDQVLEHVEDIPRFHEVDKLQRFISAKDDIAWRTFIIKGYDVWLDENAAQVPKTSELIRQLPGSIWRCSASSMAASISPRITGFSSRFSAIISAL
jgi:aspartyl/asparaginyl beta-hydroxylase (cupin superfamily)